MRPLRAGSVCTGYSGLDMAVLGVFGGELAWVADNDPGAAQILDHRHPGVKNLGDITAVNWATVDPVDILCGGFPCQDLSYAGQGAGIQEGNRSGIWYTIAYAIGVLRPRIVVLENVAAIVGRRPGLDVVICSLAALGYSLAGDCVRAADVGAPHIRDRWFALAWRDDEDPDLEPGEQRGEPARGEAAGGRARADAGRPGRALAGSAAVAAGPGDRRGRVGDQAADPDGAAGGPVAVAGGHADVADPERLGSQGQRGHGLGDEGQGGAAEAAGGHGSARGGGDAGDHADGGGAARVTEPAPVSGRHDADRADPGHGGPAGTVGDPGGPARPGDPGRSDVADPAGAGRERPGQAGPGRGNGPAVSAPADAAMRGRHERDHAGDQSAAGQRGTAPGDDQGGRVHAADAGSAPDGPDRGTAHGGPGQGRPDGAVRPAGGDLAAADPGGRDVQRRGDDGVVAGPASPAESQGLQPERDGHTADDRGPGDERCPGCGDLIDDHDSGGFCAGDCGGNCPGPQWGRPGGGWNDFEDDADPADVRDYALRVSGAAKARRSAADAADHEPERPGGQPGDGPGDTRPGPRPGDRRGASGGAPADAERRIGARGTGQPQRGPAGRTSAGWPSAADHGVQWGKFAPAIQRWEFLTGRPAPAPTDMGRTGPRLSPRFVEWMMGLPPGWVTDVPGLSRSAQLKALGNGVVPQQAVAALYLLAERARETMKRAA